MSAVVAKARVHSEAPRDGSERLLSSFRTLKAALRRTTETLAHEFSCLTAEPPDWSDSEWRIAQAAAAMHGVSSLLADRLLWRAPDGWLRFLAEQKLQTIGRHQLIARVLSALDTAARRDGVALVALKGAALHALGIYAPGERPMGDVDLLVRDADAAAAARLIEELGWPESYATWRHRVFEPRDRSAPQGFGEHVANPIRIELHTKVAERLPAFETDITRHCFPEHATAGLNAYASTAALMRHLLLHAAGNIRARALRLVQLHDISVLAARMQRDDWDELLDREAMGRAWWALPPLELVARYFPGAIPDRVISQITPDCPPLLRRVSRRHCLTDVSWSNPRLQAMPGIEWARSPREAARFVVGRIRPDREISTVLTNLSQHPWGSVAPWFALSQRARILRWLFLRPARVQTMYSVQMALHQEP